MHMLPGLGSRTPPPSSAAALVPAADTRSFVGRWADSFGALFDSAPDHGIRPAGDRHTRATLTELINFLTTVGSQLGTKIPEATKQAIEAELANVKCPAAIPWFRKTVAAAEAGKAPAPSTLDTIKSTMVQASETRAFRLAATHLERAQRESREPTEPERTEISAALMEAAQLRIALYSDGEGQRALAAAQNPEVLEALFSAPSTGSSLVDVRSGGGAIAKPNQWLLDAVFSLLEPVKGYHGYEVEGVENIPKSGRCIVAFNHSLATYDIMLFAKEARAARGRTLRMLGDHLIFKTPGLSQFATECGVVDGRPAPARKLVESEELVGVAPGGMMEMLRPTSEAYEIMWDKRRGFAKMAFETGAPVVLAACPNADDLYHVYDNPLTKAAYDYLKIPVPVFTGRFGVTPVPQPAHLEHVLSKAIYPPPKPSPRSKPGDADYEKALNEFHQTLVAEMKALMLQGRTDEAEPRQLAASGSAARSRSQA